MKAYADRRGVIGFAREGERIPSGVLIFAEGHGNWLRPRVITRSRKAYQPGVYLVPGVPEAPNDGAAFSAFRAWQAWAFPDQISIAAREIAQ